MPRITKTPGRRKQSRWSNDLFYVEFAYIETEIDGQEDHNNTKGSDLRVVGGDITITFFSVVATRINWSWRKLHDLSKDKEEHALELYRKSIVIDCHLDSTITDEYINKMLDSGLTAANLDGGGFEKIADKCKLVDEHPEALVGPVTTVREILKAKEERKIAILLGAESASELLETRGPRSGHSSSSIDLLPLVHKLGVRIVQPTYNDRNVFADGCAEQANGGLSNLGLELVESMNRLNMIVDCSHVGVKTTLDVCEHARFVVSTHSNARAVCDNVRNRSDDEIKAIAEKDGVLGIVSFPTFVKWTHGERGEWPGIEDLLDHVEHIEELVGIEHVGVGLDLVEGTNMLGPLVPGKGLLSWPQIYGMPDPDGFIRYTKGLASITDLPNLAKDLVARGYSDREVQGVLGENWLRVFKAVWRE